MSEDPIGFGAGDANIARYVNNSPALSVDPAGLQEFGFPQGPTNTASPHHVGLFLDGSVATIHQDIDPTVVQNMQSGNTLPIQIHRPWVAFGMNSNTAAGMGQSVTRPWTLFQNTPYATGDLVYSHQQIGIANSKVTPATVFEWLKTFEQFNQRNIATVRIVRPGGFEPQVFQGHQYALFRPTPVGELPTFAGLLNTGQYLINRTEVAVELFFDDEHRTVTAITLGNHMIVGIRKWYVREGPIAEASMVIATESWEQRNGPINDWAMERGGKEAMGGIWETYLLNIAAATGGTYSDVVADWPPRLPGNLVNPLLPGMPGSGLAGPAVPPGYYESRRK